MATAAAAPPTFKSLREVRFQADLKQQNHNPQFGEQVKHFVVRINDRQIAEDHPRRVRPARRVVRSTAPQHRRLLPLQE